MNKIAIVGVEGSGKTVLLSVLVDKYENPDAAGIFLSPENRRALEFTKRNVALLRSGQWPAATTTNSVLRWNLCKASPQGRRVLGELSLLDFASEHFRQAFGEHDETEKAAHTEEVQTLMSQIDDADIVLALVNLGDIVNGDMTGPRPLETMSLVKAILDYAVGRHRCAIVLTQTDSYRAVIKECGGPRETLEKYLPNVVNSYPGVPVFAVAAVHDVVPAADGFPVPARGYSSEGIDGLVAFFVEMATAKQRIIKKILKNVASVVIVILVCVCGNKGFPPPLRHYPSAQDYLEHFDKYLVQTIREKRNPATTKTWNDFKKGQLNNCKRIKEQYQLETSPDIAQAIAEIEEIIAAADVAYQNGIAYCDKAETWDWLNVMNRYYTKCMKRQLVKYEKWVSIVLEKTRALDKMIEEVEEKRKKEVENIARGNYTFDLSGVQLKMIMVKAGRFQMGSPKEEWGRQYDNETQHWVMLTKDYWLGETEVTQGQWKAVMGGNPSRFQKGDNYPVEVVSWDDAMKFCEKLNVKYEGKLPSGYKFSLPTEAQWEYACRAGMTTALNNGRNITSEDGRSYYLDEVGWYEGNSEGSTHPVAQKKPNAWGFYDMHGNVLEWCSDWYDDCYGCDGKDATDPQGPADGWYRVLRGESWDSCVRLCRSAIRYPELSSRRYDALGVRLALVPVQ